MLNVAILKLFWCMSIFVSIIKHKHSAEVKFGQIWKSGKLFAGIASRTSGAADWILKQHLNELTIVLPEGFWRTEMEHHCPPRSRIWTQTKCSELHHHWYCTCFWKCWATSKAFVHNVKHGCILHSCSVKHAKNSDSRGEAGKKVKVWQSPQQFQIHPWSKTLSF